MPVVKAPIAIILHAGNLGDAVLTTPVFDALRENGYKIHFVGKPRVIELLSQDPRIDSFSAIRPCWGSVDETKDSIKALLRLGLKLRYLKADLSLNFGSHPIPNFWLSCCAIKRRFSLKWGNRNQFAGHLIDMDDNKETYHQCDRFFQMVKAAGFGNKTMTMPKLFVFPETRLRAQALLAENFRGEPSDGPLVAIHPGSNASYKNIAFEELQLLAKKLINTINARIVLLGSGAKEKTTADIIAAALEGECVNLADMLSLPMMAAVIELCDLFVGNDSGPGHIAAAVGCRVVSIFKCTDAAIWRPYGKPESCRVVDLQQEGYVEGEACPPSAIDSIRAKLFAACCELIGQMQMATDKAFEQQTLLLQTSFKAETREFSKSATES